MRFYTTPATTLWHLLRSAKLPARQHRTSPTATPESCAQSPPVVPIWAAVSARCRPRCRRRRGSSSLPAATEKAPMNALRLLLHAPWRHCLTLSAQPCLLCISCLLHWMRPNQPASSKVCPQPPSPAYLYLEAQRLDEVEQLAVPRPVVPPRLALHGTPLHHDAAAHQPSPISTQTPSTPLPTGSRRLPRVQKPSRTTCLGISLPATYAAACQSFPCSHAGQRALTHTSTATPRIPVAASVCSDCRNQREDAYRNTPSALTCVDQ